MSLKCCSKGLVFWVRPHTSFFSTTSPALLCDIPEVMVKAGLGKKQNMLAGLQWAFAICVSTAETESDKIGNVEAISCYSYNINISTTSCLFATLASVYK